jgi:hemolysin activation/secretion protein
MSSSPRPTSAERADRQHHAEAARSTRADDPAADLFAGGTISVRGFRFSGNEALSNETLQAVTQAYIGEGRRYGALLEARDRVTRAYVDTGYISSGAVLADPPVRDGIVEIEIIEGHLTTIEVEIPSCENEPITWVAS